MKRNRVFLILVPICVAAVVYAVVRRIPSETGFDGVSSRDTGYVGSSACEECHAEFYELWSTSHHGLAMQPYTYEFANNNLTLHEEDIVVGDETYRAHVGQGEGFVRARGPDGETDYPILHVMGGKNVYYFLTKLDRGRLQTLPAAYDVYTKKWYDMAASAVRHVAAQRDEPFHWTDSPYTFNTSCHGCHVSQLSTNYDPATDTYNTTWNEPGINCESCHGPGQDHVRLCRSTPKDNLPDDLKLQMITREGGATASQVNATCSACHAKMSNVSGSFELGDEFFDHFGLITLEHPDFYPDGRDLGENYTFTTWRMSPCAEQGDLDCIHCHTSSGRYRFADREIANQACTPCHQDIVDTAADHSHHPTDSDGNVCVMCHMPTTRFANMKRSDHSMRSPAPAASMEFGSPNACTLCHTDQDDTWANKYVKEWYDQEYQENILYLGRLVKDAREENWSRLPDMLAYLQKADRDEIYANSLVQLLRNCDDNRKWDVLETLLGKDPSPLVRSSAAEALGESDLTEYIGVLVDATRDPVRLVRVRAACALSPVPTEFIKESDRPSVETALDEYETGLHARPDDWASQYNLGNLAMSRQEFRRAIEHFESAHKFRPDSIAPLVNASIAYNSIGDMAGTEQSLVKARDIEPKNVAVQLNLGMLYGELDRIGEAETAFRTAFDADPSCAAAAYNLSVILSGDEPSEAIEWAQKAHKLNPLEPKYGYTLAFFLKDRNDYNAAANVLEGVTRATPDFPDTYLLLAQIYEEQNKTELAIRTYKKALENENIPPQVRQRSASRIQMLEQR